MGTLSLVLPLDGTCTVDFGNDYHEEGTVVLAINGVTVAEAEPSTSSVVTAIDSHAGDVLTLQDQGYNSVIRLNSIELSTCFFEHGFDYASDNLPLPDARYGGCAYVETAQECCNLCRDTPQCLSFTWVDTASASIGIPNQWGWTSPACCLKSALVEPSGRSEHAGMTSGRPR